MALEHIRLAQQAKEQLVKLKRSTGIKNWNILCRWGFCLSLADSKIPPKARIPADSSVEMSWKVFGGSYQNVYLALLKQRCQKDGLGTSEEVLTSQFRAHLHRGVSYLASHRELKDISSLLRIALSECSGG